MPIKPVFPGEPPLDPGPMSTEAEKRWFAEDNAYHSLLKKRWDDWVLAHPEDTDKTMVHSFGLPPGPPAPTPAKGSAPPPPPPNRTTPTSRDSGI
jgi:hypothetical protein